MENCPLSLYRFLLPTFLCFFALPSYAGTLNSGDTAWMLTATALVLFMTIPGLALFYGGMVRKKNVLSVVMQCFTITCLVTIIWAVIGYSLAFSKGNGFIGNLDNDILKSLSANTLTGTIPESLFMVFQMTFAIIAPALITGSFAERMKFSAMLWFIGLWSVLIYSPIAHWVWGPDGWLAGKGVLDFAGGDVIHINAGIAGLMAAIVLGPRKGYGRDNMAPHNLVLTAIGGAMLWIGWFGFNAGSALSAGSSAAMAMVVTQIATGAAGLSWMAVEWYQHGKPSLLGIVSGAVSGLVGITPAAGFVTPMGALILGVVAGPGCYWGATWLKHKFNYDDSLDCWGVHGIGGIIGAIMTGLLASKAISGTAGAVEGNWMQLPIQLLGAGATIVYSGIGSFILLKIIDKCIGLRIDSESEQEGLDLACHDERVL